MKVRSEKIIKYFFLKKIIFKKNLENTKNILLLSKFSIFFNFGFQILLR